MTWIPVTDRLPADDQPVLVCVTAESPVWIGWYEGGAWYWDDGWQIEGSLFCHKVLAWQPLPEPMEECECGRTIPPGEGFSVAPGHRVCSECAPKYDSGEPRRPEQAGERVVNPFSPEGRTDAGLTEKERYP